jgi:histidine triad (HIT) family protein
MPSCIFCEIHDERAEVSRVYEDEICLVFMDIQPVNPGHVLVIPKKHATDLADLPPETGAHLFRVAQRIALSLPASGIKCEGINLFLAHCEAAGQDVFHAQLHVIPRYPRAGFGFRFSPRYLKRPSRASLNEPALKIRNVLEQENK